MKKIIKILFILIQIMIVLALVFFAFDINRVYKNEEPIFSKKTGIYKDGSIEYYGIGYKVIKYVNPKIKKEYEYKMGTLFMKFINPYTTHDLDVNTFPTSVNN